MAASNPSRFSRKIWRLGLAVVVAALIYTAGWFYATSQIKERLQLAFGGANPIAAEVDCGDMDMRGFPFRLGLHCSKLAVDDHRNGISATFGSLRTAAQIYAPGHVVWELDGPAEIRSAFGPVVLADWKNLRSSLSAGFSGVNRTSLTADEVKATVSSTLSTEVVDVTAKRGELHLRRNDADLDVAMLMENAQAVIRDSAIALPLVSTSADLTLAGKADFIDLRDVTGAGLYGASGEVRRLVFDLGDGKTITVSGPFSFNDSGYLSGDMRVDVEGIDAWSQTLQAGLPQLSKQVKSATNMLKALFGGKNTGGANFTIRDGTVTLSFIPLGRLPPI